MVVGASGPGGLNRVPAFRIALEIEAVREAPVKVLEAGIGAENFTRSGNAVVISRDDAGGDIAGLSLAPGARGNCVRSVSGWPQGS